MRLHDGIQFWIKGNQRARMSFDLATPFIIPISEGASAMENSTNAETCTSAESMLERSGPWCTLE